MGYEGDVKLTDFGIAKALNLMYNEEGKVIAGKDEYLSPEQASYAVTDARARRSVISAWTCRTPPAWPTSSSRTTWRWYEISATELPSCTWDVSRSSAGARRATRARSARADDGAWGCS